MALSISILAPREDRDVGLRFGSVVQSDRILHRDHARQPAASAKSPVSALTHPAWALPMGAISMTSPSSNSTRASSPKRPASPITCHSPTVKACRTAMHPMLHSPVRPRLSTYRPRLGLSVEHVRRSLGRPRSGARGVQSPQREPEHWLPLRRPRAGDPGVSSRSRGEVR